MPKRVARLAVVFLMALGSAWEAGAQHFGRNKVEYADFDFHILETQHFDLYYYPAEENAARMAARMAERWYARLARVLEHELDGRQALILYGSQPEFAQTNVVDHFLGEGVGGVTELARRRIVMPFATTLRETERILGHELTHAFQMDLARRYRGGLRWPLWAVEGLAQYLSLGASDAETVMWLRDAVRWDLLPERQQDAARKFSPYRYGHALWAYMAGRFGDGVVPGILKARDAGSLERRIKSVTGLELQQIFDDWRAQANAQYARAAQPGSPKPPAGWAGGRNGRMLLGPSLSPDGRRAVFFSERDRLSLDLYLADTASGEITRKLATTAATARVESLQALRSAGAWSPEGDRYVYPAIERGEPALILIDVDGHEPQRTIRLRQFGQVLTPSWSPDGRTIAFSALTGGTTDLYLYEVATGAIERLTDDPYGDVQPEWSPDGRQIAFVTERFSSDATGLRFGRCGIAIMDVDAGIVRPVTAFERGRHVNPQWSPDGAQLYFVADPDGVSNVYRIDLASGALSRLTDVAGGVSGITPTSPALSVARSAPVLAFTVYRAGKYDIEFRRDVDGLRGEAAAPAGLTADATRLPPESRSDGIVEEVLADADAGDREATEIPTRKYAPTLFLEALGPPHVTSGSGPFGSFVRGGGSFLFSDLLGERKLALFAQAGNRMRDLAIRVQFLNRERRWNWGALAEVEPSLRRLPRTWSGEVGGAPALTMQTHYFERTQVRAAGLLAYPLDRARRFEFELGARHTAYRRSVRSVVRSLVTGRVIERGMAETPADAPATVGEASAAYVRDTSIFGPTSPILGARSRFEVTSTFGELSVTRLLLDYRRYLMPIRPYTIAFRGVHIGQYGPDAHDARLLPTFLGSRQFLRGYGWRSVHCNLDDAGACSGFDELLGSRLLVGNLEVRAPILGLKSRELRYSPVPLEGYVFADAGLVWHRSPAFSAASGDRRLVRSFGAGVRLNAFGFPIQVGAVRAVDPPSTGWSLDFSFQMGF